MFNPVFFPTGGSGEGGTVGPAGKSAYQIAVQNGFVGTEIEWLASLEGEPGADGVDGQPGVDGKSAYAIALDNGFVGSEAEWLASFTGTPEFNITDLPIWSAAVRAQKAGYRNARIMCLGDSTTAGHGALAVGMVSNNISASYPKVLSDLLTARGSKASWQNFVGTHSAAVPKDFDTRLSYGASWGATPGARTVGGPTFVSAGTPTTMGFAPTEAWDTAEVFFTRGDPANGTGIVVGINGTDYATYPAYYPSSSPNNSDPVVVRTSLGQKTLNFRGLNTFSTYLLGGVVYRSDIKQILVLNGGWSAAKASDWLIDQAQSYGPLNSLALYKPDLVLVNLGINDANANVAKADYQAQMQQIINASRNSGADVVLVIPNAADPNTVGTRLTTLSTWIAELATTNNLLCIDLRTNLGTYSAAVASGYMRDNLHPNAAGYAIIAGTIADVIMPASAGILEA